jgi:N-acetylglucosamine kinase-like BadF-type ATPase
LAREGLRLFSRMSDGRTPRGALDERVRRQFGLDYDLDLCAAIYGKSAAQRSQFAQLSKLVAEAAGEGDAEALALFAQAAREMAQMLDAVHAALGVPAGTAVPVSCSAGLFEAGGLLLTPLAAELRKRWADYQLVRACLPPDVGAAIHAAKLAGHPLGAASISALQA